MEGVSPAEAAAVRDNPLSQPDHDRDVVVTSPTLAGHCSPIKRRILGATGWSPLSPSLSLLVEPPGRVQSSHIREGRKIALNVKQSLRVVFGFRWMSLTH